MNQQKSIGIICSSKGFGGLEMNTIKLAHYLLQSGWKVNLLLNELSPMMAEVKEEHIKTSSIQQFGAKSKLSFFVLRRWMKTINVNLIFTPYNKDIKAISLYKRLFHHQLPFVFQQHMKVGVAKRDLIHKLRYQMIDWWISPLPYLKEETKQLTTIPEGKIKVIPLGLDFKKFNLEMQSSIDVRRLLGIPTDCFTIGILGRIDPKKGHDFVIRCLSVLKQQYQFRAQLLIMGNVTHLEGDDYFNSLKTIIKEHDLNNQVFFKPYQKNVTVFYEAIDVFAMPSHGETYGMVTLESMLMKKPIVGVNTDGTKALLKNGQLGWLHKLNDEDTFCKHVIALSKSNSEIESIIEDAHNEVLQHFNIDKTMKATEDLLLQALEK